MTSKGMREGALMEKRITGKINGPIGEKVGDNDSLVTVSVWV